MTTEQDRIYWVWADMLLRCRNKNHRSYVNYGARGIYVCERWAQNFWLFVEDMGPRPKGGMIDRIDNDGPYTPTNCRWATRKEQNSNRRSCIYVYDGSEQVTLKEYCCRKDIKYRPIVKRIQDRGWPIDLALSTPVGAGKKLHLLIGKDAA